MGLVRLDCICSDPIVARRVFDIVPFSRMCPQSILRWRRLLHDGILSFKNAYFISLIQSYSLICKLDSSEAVALGGYLC
jgi:hypothetical protein